jgi:hypothetical protein
MTKMEDKTVSTTPHDLSRQWLVICSPVRSAIAGFGVR